MHDILVWIRGSMPLTNGSEFGSGSCYFRHRPSRRQQKTNWKKSAFLHLHHFLKIKVKKKPQNSRNQGFFLLFLLDDRSGSIPLTNGSGVVWIQEAQKHADPSDPDSDPLVNSMINLFSLLPSTLGLGRNAEQERCGLFNREKQCCGSGSVGSTCFWASRIWIAPDPYPSITKQK
jgi:hypothetical protein